MYVAEEKKPDRGEFPQIGTPRWRPPQASLDLLARRLCPWLLKKGSLINQRKFVRVTVSPLVTVHHKNDRQPLHYPKEGPVLVCVCGGGLCVWRREEGRREGEGEAGEG